MSSWVSESLKEGKLAWFCPHFVNMNCPLQMGYDDNINLWTQDCMLTGDGWHPKLSRALWVYGSSGLWFVRIVKVRKGREKNSYKWMFWGQWQQAMWGGVQRKLSPFLANWTKCTSPMLIPHPLTSQCCLFECVNFDCRTVWSFICLYIYSPDQGCEI